MTKQRKIRHIRGRATFSGATGVEIETEDGGLQSLSFDHAIIATGSRPVVLPGFPADSNRLLDSTSALDLHDVPGKLLIVGGGYIGLELGSVYSALGSKVTVIEMMPSLLPGADKDLVRPLAKKLEREFESILLGTKVVEVKEQKNGLKVRLEGNDIDKPDRLFDKVLVSVGRRPNSEGLGLENTSVQIDDQGFIQVNAQLRTAEATIHAIGDVVGQPMLAHKASHEGRTAVEAIAGHKVAFEPQAIPAVVFTDPEVAWCGLTENEARAQGRKVGVARFPWAASGRAKTLGRIVAQLDHMIAKVDHRPRYADQIVAGSRVCDAFKRRRRHGEENPRPQEHVCGAADPTTE